MKKILFILTLLTAGIFTSCDKMMDPIFDEPADVRLQKALDHYQQTLVSAPNGWILTIPTGLGGVYRFWVSFDENNRVASAADFNHKVMESSYRLRVISAPMLSFDTGCYITQICDPDPSISGAADSGTGQKSDFDFYFLEENAGSFLLLGRFNFTPAILEPASAAEAAAILDGGFEKSNEALTDFFGKVKYPAVNIDGKNLQLNVSTRSASYQYWDDATASLISGDSPCYVDLDGEVNGEQLGTVYFISEVPFMGKNIIQLDWDEQAKAYQVKTDDGGSYPLFDNLEPIIPIEMVLGVGLTYSGFRTDVADLTGSLTGDFLQLYNDVNTKLGGLSNRSLDYIDFTLYPGAQSPVLIQYEENGEDKLAQTVLEVTFRYVNSSGSGYNAQWYWRVTTDSNGFYTFDLMTQYPNRTNENNTRSAYLDVFDYINGHRFKLSWIPNNTPGSSANIAGFYVVDSAGNETDSFIAGIVK
ncbi:MAG: DUF4302 domain-containing protein [Prevotellaceae bacterium]|nr:DUF4302 domain-containing protein [Prevotellaceae bacterium]